MTGEAFLMEGANLEPRIPDLTDERMGDDGGEVASVEENEGIVSEAGAACETLLK